MKLPSLAEVKKAVAGLLAALPFLIAQGVVSGQLAHVLLVVGGVLGTALGVYVAPANKPKPATSPPTG